MGTSHREIQVRQVANKKWHRQANLEIANLVIANLEIYLSTIVVYIAHK